MLEVIDDITLDEATSSLYRGSERLEVEPLVVRLIALLARNGERVTTKDEMVSEVWSGQAISDSAITRAVSMARRAIRSEASPQPIRSVYGVGYQLVGEPFPRYLSVGSATSEGLFGRQSELEDIEARLISLRQGHGTVALVEGEAGIGKTSLLEAVGARAMELGFVTRIGRCAPSSGAPAYWPWIQVLRQEFREAGPPASHEVDAVSERLLLQLVAPTEGASTTGSAGSRFALFDAVTQLLAWRASSQPLVISLDDVHNADRESLALLSLLAPHSRSVPLLLLIAARDTEARANESHSQLIAATGAAAGPIYSLSGLSRADVESFLVARGIAAEQAEIVHERTGGNPLFITHLVSFMDKANQALGHTPPGLSELIRQRLDALPPPALASIRAAALLGSEFEALIFAELFDDPECSRLSPTVSAGLIMPTGRPETRSYRFCHELVRDFLYESIPDNLRAEMHARVARGLETLKLGSPALVAHHYRAAISHQGDAAAIRSTTAAADHAARAYAYEEAVVLYGAVEELYDKRDEAPSSRRALNLVKLAETLSRAGRPVEAWETAVKAGDYARELDSADLLAKAALAVSPGILSIETARFDPRHVDLLEEAIAWTRRSGDRRLLTELLCRLSTALYWSGKLEEQRARAAEATQLAEELRETALVEKALYAYHAALWRPGSLEERLPLAEQLVGLKSRSGAEPSEDDVIYRSILITDLSESGDLQRLSHQIALFHRQAGQVRSPESIWLSPMFQGMYELLTGRFNVVPRLTADLKALGERVSSADASSCWAAQTALYNFEAGRGATVIDALVQHAATHPNVLHLFRTAPAWAAAEIGQADVAQAFLDGFVRTGFAEIPMDMNRIGSLVVLSMAAAELRDRSSAEKLLELLKDHVDQFAILGYSAVSFGSVAAHAGRLAAVIGEQATAQDLLQRGIQANARAGAKPWVARATYAFGVALGDWGRTDEAKGVLREALALSQAMGMRHMTARCLTALSICSPRTS